MDCYAYYTDGAATMKNKNGKYLREAGGWAFILLKNGKEVSRQSGGCPLTTNNEMELYAIYASMRDFLDNSNYGDLVEIYSDSSYYRKRYRSGIQDHNRRGDIGLYRDAERSKADCNAENDR